MDIDYERITRIVEELRPLDMHQAYYVKDTVMHETVGPLVPPIEQIIRNACLVCPRALDVGFGDGHTLLKNADILEQGVGVDDSEHMIQLATAARDKRGVTNIDFRFGKAIDIPFENRAFDLVFSQRGPLGHHDGTLAEALRVLRQEGLILVETGGDFDTLETEKNRFEKQGVDLQLGSAFTEKLVFSDCYEFFRHYCVSWCTYDAARELDVGDRGAIDRVLAAATDEDGALCFHWSRILIGGRKKGI